MQASRTVRRAPAAQARAAAGAGRTSTCRRLRPVPRARAALRVQRSAGEAGVARRRSTIPNDRLRDVAYAYFEDNPDPPLAPRCSAQDRQGASEFVRPALIRALAAHGADPKVQRCCAKSFAARTSSAAAVIEALGAHKATYALADADGDRQAGRPAAGRCRAGARADWRQARAATLAALQRAAPRERQPTLAAAICLLGSNCDSHETFSCRRSSSPRSNLGYQDLARSSATACSKLAAIGRARALATS